MPLKPRSEWQLIGKPLHRLDLRSKVNGSATFGIDVRRPGNAVRRDRAVARVRRLARMRSMRRRRCVIAACAASSSSTDAVVVVADSYWTAQKALAELKPVWRHGSDGERQPRPTISERLRALTHEAGKAYVAEGQDEAKVRERCEAELAKARRVVERTYEAPLLSHSPMEPMNGTAFVRDGRAELWVPTQVQSDLRTDVAKALGFDESAVTIHTTELGGGFGRRLQTDYGVQAALVAREMGVPVKLIWSREEDTQHGFYRPAAAVRLRAALGADDTVTAFRAQIACLDGDTPVGGWPVSCTRCRIPASPTRAGIPACRWARGARSMRRRTCSSSKASSTSWRAELRQEPLALRRRLLRDNAASVARAGRGRKAGALGREAAARDTGAASRSCAATVR